MSNSTSKLEPVPDNNLSEEHSRQVIGALISNHLSKYPHDTGFFMNCVTHGLNEFAKKQRDDACVFLNYLTDVMVSNPKIKDGGLYDVGQIAANILPRWEGAGIHKELVKMFGEKAEKYKGEVEAYKAKKKKEEENSYSNDNDVENKFGTTGGFKKSY